MRLALIAGQGQLPAALAAGLPEVPLVCALQGFMPTGLAVDLVFRLETLGSFLHQLQQRGITHLCMCGAIRRPAIDPAAIDAATRPLVPVLQQALAAGDDGALRAVIGLFQDTIEKVVALAVLMPIVASMGGIAGTQSLTVLIRAMAMGQINDRTEIWLVRREILVSLINGLLWAAVIAFIASYWFSDVRLGLIIAFAIVINLITAGIAGASLPLLLDRLDIDPALAGGVVLTTITDVVGFFAFLGLAAYFYG